MFAQQLDGVQNHQAAVQNALQEFTGAGLSYLQHHLQICSLQMGEERCTYELLIVLCLPVLKSVDEGLPLRVFLRSCWLQVGALATCHQLPPFINHLIPVIDQSSGATYTSQRKTLKVWNHRVKLETCQSFYFLKGKVIS